MIYIAYDYNDKCISIVNAKSLELANAYWQGKGCMPHRTKSLDDFISLDEHPTGVYDLVKIREFTGSEISQKINRKSDNLFEKYYLT